MSIFAFSVHAAGEQGVDIALARTSERGLMQVLQWVLVVFWLLAKAPQYPVSP